MTESRSVRFLEAYLSLTVDRCLEGDVMKGSYLVGFIEDTGVQVLLAWLDFREEILWVFLVICQACECVWHWVLGACKD